MTDEEYQELIQVETGTTGDQTVERYLPSWWGLYSGESVKNRQFLKTKKRVVLYLLGKHKSSARDITIGPDRFSSSQIYKNLGSMLEQIDKELAETDTDRHGFATVAPIAPDLLDTLGETVADREVYYTETRP